jgi:hypothetical protein
LPCLLQFDRVLLQHATAVLSEDDPRSQGITNQPWQVGDLPDLAQPNTAAAALEAAVEDGNPSSGSHAMPTRPSALAAGGEAAAGAPASSSTGAGEQAPAPAGGKATPGTGLFGGWRVDAAEQLRKVPVLGARRRTSGTEEQPVDAAQPPSAEQQAAALQLLQEQQERQRLVQEAAARAAAREEQELAAAIAASLEQVRLEEEARLRAPGQQPQVEGSTGTTAAAVATPAAAGVQQGAREPAARSRSVPADALDEEHMLQLALTLSLQDSAAAAAVSTPAADSNGDVSEAKLVAEQGASGEASSSNGNRSSSAAATAHPAAGSSVPDGSKLSSSSCEPVSAAAEPPSAHIGQELAATGAAGQAAAVGTAGSTSPSSRSVSPGAESRGDSYQGVKVSRLRRLSAGSQPTSPRPGAAAAAPGPPSPGASSTSQSVRTVSQAHSPVPGVNSVSLRRSAGGAQV